MKNKFKAPKIFLAITIFALSVSLAYAMSSYPLSKYTNFNITSKTSSQLNIKVTNENLQSNDLRAKVIDELKNSQTPFISQSRLIAVPINGDVEIKIKNVDSTFISLTEQILISNHEITDAPMVSLGKTGVMRDFYVAPLIVKQYRYDATSKQIICYNNIEFELKFNSPPQLINTNQPVSETWSNVYKNSIMNYDENSLGIFNLGTPQGYLIIVADALYDSILSFARWKNLKGYTITVKKVSEVGGNNSTNIRNYIRTAYETWTPRLEYVLLVGGSGLITGIPIAVTSCFGDHLYACLEGDDLYPELFIGRFPVTSVSELAIITSKIFGYEKIPYMADTLWYRKGLMVGTQYSTGQPVWTSLETCRWARMLLLAHNFIQVDTVYDPPLANGVGIIDTFVNRGISFLNARGWGNSQGWHRPQFYIDAVNNNLNNGWKLPIVTSFYCATANYAASQCFGTAWLVNGTPTNPKGGIGFYGPTFATTSSRFNNCQDYGVYWGIFEEKINNFGPAMFRGKIEMFDNYPMPADSQYLRIHVCTYTVLGDPSMEMWTGVVPKQLNVGYSTQIPLGSSTFTVNVQNTNSQPVIGALVSLYKTGEIKLSEYTDNSGNALFNFTTQSQDTLFVTVTAHDYKPHLGTVSVTSQPIYVGYYSSTGNVIAGQTINLNISLKNYGSSQTASNVFATLRTQSNQVTILDSTKSYGSITPGQVVAGGPFQFSVAANCTNNYKVNFQLLITSGANNWQAGFSTSVRAAELGYKRHIVNDGGNQILDPGETANLLVKIVNRGLENINNVTGILRCTNPNAIRVTDSVGTFGNVSAGDSVQNTADYFTVQASPTIGVGRKFYFQLILRNSSGYQRIIEFPITIGAITSTAVLGPDAYGYWAYDNTDLNYNEHPTYSWFEIDPNFGGAGTSVALHADEIKTVYLPFTFRYYGANFTRISVCSNGYIAMDSSWLVDPYNWNIPSPFGPPSMIAVMWDDFHPDTLGASGVYYYNDAANNRFIIEWSRVRHIHGFRDPSVGEMQTFQIILLNQANYVTRTGDGPIIFQYNTVFNDDSLSSDCHDYATVGIENQNHSTGIEYTFAGRYPSAAAQLVSGRSIKFTTNLPDTFSAINEQYQPYLLPSNYANLVISPNPFKSQTTISYAVPVHSSASVAIYDINGRLVENIKNMTNSPGTYHIRWSRKEIPSGIYYAVLTVKNENNIMTKRAKIVLY